MTLETRLARSARRSIRRPAATALASATVAAALLLIGCAGQPGEPEPPPAETAIPHPSLAEMDPAVAAVLKAKRQAVDQLLAGGEATPAERARALGELGQLYQAHRLVEPAEACYREAHTLDPAAFDWAYYLGILAARSSDLERAAEAFRAALELHPGDLPAIIRLADLELDRGRIETAEELYVQALSLDPTTAAAEYGMGRIAAERRRYPEAIEHFDRALALQPRATVIHYHLGQAYRQLGRLDQATTHLEQSGPVELAMRDPLMWRVTALVTGAAPFLAQGSAALRDGRLSAAVSAFRRVVEIDPENTHARQSLAGIFTLLGDPAAAAGQLEVLVGLAPTNARAWADLGSALADLGDEARALESLQRAVELDPGLQAAQLNLANALARAGRIEEAEHHYRSLLEIDAEDLVARSRLGTVLAQSGRLEEAIDELRRVVRQDPGDLETRLNLGIALAEAGEIEAAIAQHLDLVELAEDPRMLARTHFNLGSLHLRGGDSGQALAQFLLALEHDDLSLAAHLNAANLLARSGRLEEALAHFTRARELQPEHEAALLGEATTLLYLGRFTAARAILEAAVEQRPDVTAPAHALARLLAAAPEPAVRDGSRSLELITRLQQNTDLPVYSETRAMALAELGRFDEAADLQRTLLTALGRGGRTAAIDRMSRNLERYRERRACCARPTDLLVTD